MTDYEKLLELLDKAKVEYDEGIYYSRGQLPCKMVNVDVDRGYHFIDFYFDENDEIIGAR